MTYRTLWQRLAAAYELQEAKAISRLVFETLYGLSLGDICAGRDEGVDHGELEAVAQRLESHEPVQYVLGQTIFMGRVFRCDHRALIPRPETEELCEWALQMPFRRLLDVGTGTGCIAITMALGAGGAQVDAIDLSADALVLASENAERLGARVRFVQRDALALHAEPEPLYDLIVSNPPYICREEAAAMEHNVLDHEPHAALFVPDNDPLLFYRAIANYGRSALTSQGHLFFEINPRFADALCDMLLRKGYVDVTPRSDAFGKTRFIKATR